MLYFTSYLYDLFGFVFVTLFLGLCFLLKTKTDWFRNVVSLVVLNNDGKSLDKY